MKIKTILISCLLLLQTKLGWSQTPAVYKIYSSEGKEVSYRKMEKELSEKQVVLIGELHDNAVVHWIELLLTKSFFASKGTQLAVGSEMFETHQSVWLKKYLKDGNLKALRDSTKLWSNFGTDYKPVLEFAYTNKLEYFAANVPRKYASLVFKKGLASLDSLPEGEKKLFCPLPYPFDSTLSQYRELIKMGMEMHASGLNFALSQAIKDATMAWNITQALQTHQQVIHFNGAYHSDFHQSIEWYLHYYQPSVRVGTVTTVTQADVYKLEGANKGRADFIIVVDETFTKTME